MRALSISLTEFSQSLNSMLFLGIPSILTCNVVLVVVFWSAQGAEVEITPDFEYQKIQIESHSRDYKAGPIAGTYTVSIHDQILLTVEAPDDAHVWQWLMVGQERTEEKVCELSRVYKRGGCSASMKCSEEGVYVAFAKKVPISSINKELSSFLNQYVSQKNEEDMLCSEGNSCLDIFEMIDSDAVTDKAIQAATSDAKGVIQSFPVKLVSTEYCFQWAYKIEEIEKVGYIHTEAEPINNEGSFVSYRIRVWVVEANAMSEGELAHKFPQAEYSGVLTRRFKTKGLEPCFRFSHQAIELLTPDPKYICDPSREGIFWMMDFKVHTDSIVSTLSDISFTIGSRQHIALYGCFIAETRVLLDPRQFSFLGTNRNEIQKINLAHSEMPSVMKRHVTGLTHIFGHFVRYVGHPWDYERTLHRRDMQIFQNPCMTLEFGFAARGVGYMAQNWLSYGMDDVSRISLPWLGDTDVDEDEKPHIAVLREAPPDNSNDVSKTARHVPQTKTNSSAQVRAASVTDPKNKGQKPKSRPRARIIDAYDFAITPTHLVFLSADSHIVLYPTSVIYKGFGYIRNAQSYRPGSLVQRRWCATTGTPKEHNMIVPAFSSSGNFIIIQILPIERTTTMWLQTPLQSCLKQQGVAFYSNDTTSGSETSTLSDEDEEHRKIEEQNKLEVCIHRKEVSKVRSKLDEENVEEIDPTKEDHCTRLLPDEDDKGKSHNSSQNLNTDLDSRLKFWVSGQTLLTEKDPHFIHMKDDPGKQKVDTSSSDFNRHILYEVDKKGAKIKDVFQENGLNFHTGDTAHYERKTYLWLHDVQFTAVERKFMQAVEFKSEMIQNSELSMAILNVIMLDEPVKLVDSEERELLETDYMFSGVLIVKPQDPKSEAEGKGSDATVRRLTGSAKTFTTNTALCSYVIHIDNLKDKNDQDTLIYATFDGTHARPLSYLDEIPGSPSPSGSASKSKPQARIRFTGQHPSKSLAGKPEGILKPDFMMTEHGIISILWRKGNLSNSVAADPRTEPRDNYPQAVIVGSIIVTEPLRKVMPFKGTSYIFQRVTADGEIVYGEYFLQTWVDKANPPAKISPAKRPEAKLNLIDIKQTKFLSIPFESLVVGSMEAEMKATAGTAVATAAGTTPASAEVEAVSDICPYADFVVHFIPFDFAEVEYRTRITAELVFLGSTLPLEADILVEFDDSHGISVMIHSGIEENRDQTLVRKTVDIHTFLTPATLHKMYKYPDSHEDNDEIKEEIIIFTLTMRPSISNLHCPKKLFFKTIQVNVGCNPFTMMRFIPEAVGLKKVKFLRSTSSKDRDNHWTVSKSGEYEDEYEVTIPRGKTNFAQRKLLKCDKQHVGKQQRGRGHCTIPKKYTNLFKENIYSIHFTKSVVPKFEQFLTRHVRRVTGNVFLYKILGGEMNINTSLLDSKCHNLAPHCAPLDESCGSLLNSSQLQGYQEQPWTTSFFKRVEHGEVDLHTDIYRHFRDCFNSHRITADQDEVMVNRDLPSRMHSERYWLFNSSNYNAFSFKKHRNMIFLIRAVVVNTQENGFTFCQRLETFFLLHMIGVAPARRPLPWHFYLALVTFVLFILIIIYFYFARSSKWRSEVSMRRIREEEEKEQREVDAKNYQEQQMKQKQKMSGLGKWAGRVRDVVQDKDTQGGDAIKSDRR